MIGIARNGHPCDREVHKDVNKSYLLYEFPASKRRIAELTYGQKLEWYAYQFQKDARVAAINLSTPEFARFWKWQVLVPMKIKRFFYRIKNGEIFKKYQHITEMKKKVKPHSI